LPSIYSFLGKEKLLIPLGLIAAALNGSVMPIFGFLFGKLIGVLNLI
jgi:hypothetical protein